MTNLSFDNGTVEQFTLVLSQRDFTHLGQISNVDKIKFTANMNAADELSFVVYKELDGIQERLWEDIYDLRLVWVRELNEYFEIEVESTDTVYITKTITAKSLCESELSQTYLHDIEINTADDIARPDYDPNFPTVFFRVLPSDPTSEEYEKKRNSSLLHRILEKVPAYTIGHVDETLMNLQRIFSISDSTIYDFLTGECSEQFNCLFQFDSTTRTVSAYDLKTTCHNNLCDYYINEDHKYYSGDVHIRYRGLFNDRCPICGSTDISSFGEDTTVFVSTSNLTDEVKFDTDVASLKNCFRLEAGDDNMTAAVINSNPNGTRYIYEFNDDSKKDMPQELVDLIESYDELYDRYNNTEDTNLDTSLIGAYNELCQKYDEDMIYHRGNEWKPIDLPVLGYKNLIPHYYNCIDFYSYLKSSLMPVVIIPKTTVAEERDKLVSAFLEDNIVGVSTEPKVQSTVESAITNLCKLYVNTGIVKVNVSTSSGGWDVEHWSTWRGIIRLTSFEDDTDYADTPEISLVISTDFATFMDQKISKYIKRSKESVELYDVLKIQDIEQYKEQLKLYSATRLQSFKDAIQAVLGILIEADQGHDGTESFVKANPTASDNPKEKGWYEKVGDIYVQTNDTAVVSGKDYYVSEIPKSILYDPFYLPYYNKLIATEEELNLRNQEIALVYGTHDLNGNVQTKGVLQYIVESITEIQRILNFRNYIYENTDPNSYDLYNLYTTYIREDTYSNSNYISDDLNNDQLFENAGKFLDLAKDELHKSATYQHSISSNVNNLIAIKEFRPLLDKFSLGNWIRVQEDDKIYRLRLISYSIDFDNITTLNTEFSDVTITANGLNDIMSVIKQASSMASSYSYTQQQAEAGSQVKTNYIDDWLQNGLNSSLIRINNNDDEDISIDNTGILARSYDDIHDNYDQEQLRITHNVIAFTDDGWRSVKTSLGKFSMTHHTVDETGLNRDANAISRYDEYGLVANAVLAGWIVGSYIEGGNIISSHYQTPGNNSYIDMSDVVTAGSGKEYFLKFNDSFKVNKNGHVYANDADLTGSITANSGKVGNWNILPIDSTYYIGAGALYYYPDGKILGYDSDTAVFSPEGCVMSPGPNQKRFGWTSKPDQTTPSGGTEETFVFGVGNNFGINLDGKVYASDIEASGKIIATSGEIGLWNVDPETGYTIGAGALYYGSGNSAYILAPNGTASSYTIPGQSGSTQFKIKFGPNFGIDTSGNAYLNGNITAKSGKIGKWEIDNINSSSSTYGYLYSMKSSGSQTAYSYIASDVIHLVNYNSGWKQFLANALNGYFAVHNSVFYVTNNGSDLDWTYNPANASLYVQIGSNNIYRKSDNTYVVWHTELSDRNAKKEIKELDKENIRTFFEYVKPSSFKFKKKYEEYTDNYEHYGVIAQNIEEAAIKSDLLNYSLIRRSSIDNLLHVGYQEFHGIELAGIKDLYEIVRDQQKQINDILNELNRLKGETNG